VKSGVSGAGRKAEIATLMSETGESFKSYGVSGHRHLPEITQGLKAMTNQHVNLTFVPHLTPMIRGIHATLYASLTHEITQSQLQALFEKHYADEFFVDILPQGSHPDTRNVRGSNRCQIAVHLPQNGKTVVVLSVIDNLVKGAAGQAVQAMNLRFGFHENHGLSTVALYP
jgi:N-acetyl-gamma-glutamyl-phosphate reductase